LHAGEELFGTVIGVRDDNFQTLGMSVRLKSAIDIEEKRILHVGNDDAENSALSARERACVEVRVVVQFLGRFQDARARGGFDNLEIVENAGNRGRGNTCFLSHGIQTHCQRTPLAH
jgi:hypothetical protein